MKYVTLKPIGVTCKPIGYIGDGDLIFCSVLKSRMFPKFHVNIEGLLKDYGQFYEYF